jgi:hypothetical protein
MNPASATSPAVRVNMNVCSDILERSYFDDSTDQKVTESCGSEWHLALDTGSAFSSDLDQKTL